jgi:hypothetical protein
MEEIAMNTYIERIDESTVLVKGGAFSVNSKMVTDIDALHIALGGHILDDGQLDDQAKYLITREGLEIDCVCGEILPEAFTDEFTPSAKMAYFAFLQHECPGNFVAGYTQSNLPGGEVYEILSHATGIVFVDTVPNHDICFVVCDSQETCQRIIEDENEFEWSDNILTFLPEAMLGYIRTFDNEGSLSGVKEVKIASIDALNRFLAEHGVPEETQRHTHYSAHYSLYTLTNDR